MTRYHAERQMAERRQKKFRQITGCERPVGAFRKRRTLDCGKSKCQLCHSVKFPKRLPTRQEKQADGGLDEGATTV